MPRPTLTRTAVSACTFLLAALLPVAAKPSFAQGFGAEKETVTLHAVLPAIVQLPSPEVRLVVLPAAPGSAPFATSLLPELQALIQKGDSRIATETGPDTGSSRVLVECSITRFTPYASKAVKVSGDVKVKNKILPGETDQNISAQITVAYRAIDLKTHRPLDAAVLEAKIDENYAPGGTKKSGSILGGFKDSYNKTKDSLQGKARQDDSIPTPQQVNDRLVEEISQRLVARIVNTNQELQVKLAKGKLDHEAKVGGAGEWQEMLKNLTVMSPLDPPEEDAYRLYDMGVAYEAMGYKSSSRPDDAIPLFELAAIKYKAAVAANGNEKYFLEPQVRVETALVNMKTIKERSENGNSVPQSDLKETAGLSAGDPKTADKPAEHAGPAVTPASQDDDTLTNASIINLSKKGMDKDNLIAAIQDAKKFDFKLTPSAMGELRDANVPNEVISAMRQKIKAAQATTPAVRRASRPAGGQP